MAPRSESGRIRLDALAAAGDTFSMTVEYSDAAERMNTMAADKEPSGAEKMFGNFAPALVHFTNDVLFGQVWPSHELSQRIAAS